MEKLYVVEFIYEGVNNLFLKKMMAKELMKGYKVFADRANSGITDKINSDFKSLYPNYFENNKDKEWYDLTEYNQYIADEFNQLICNTMNKKNVILNVMGIAMFLAMIAGSMFIIWYFYMTPLHILFYVMKIKGVSLETILRVISNLSIIKDMIGVISVLVIMLATIEVIIIVNSIMFNIKNRSSKVSI